MARLRLIRDGWLDGIPVIESPNFDDRPVGVLPELIVIHAISLPEGRFGTNLVERLFTNKLPNELDPNISELRETRVSAHFYIDRSGLVTQFVSTICRAWHAGVSVWEGKTACNDFSIGIELEGCDYLPFDRKQYSALACLINNLVEHIPTCSWDSVVGHSDIAPSRKTDPGPFFNWEMLQKERIHSS